MSNVTGQSQRETLTTTILFAGIALVYLAFLTKNYYWDGITFADAIETAPSLNASLVHANHLIYNLVGYFFYKALKSLAPELRAVTALQILSALCGALTAALLFRILLNILRSRYYAISLTLLFAFSATWWRFATDADAYILSVLFILLSFYFVLPGRKPQPLLVALVYSFGLCLHQMALLFFPVLLLAIFIQDKTLDRRRRILNCIGFSVVAGGLTFGAYLYAYFLLTGRVSIAETIVWSLSYSPDENFGFHPLNNLGFTLRGHARLFFGGRLNAISGLITPMVMALSVAWLLLLLTLVVKLLRSIRNPGWEWLRDLRQDPERLKVTKLCLLWIGVNVLVFYSYVSHHTFYRLFYLPAIIILLGLLLDTYQRVNRSSRKYRLLIFAVFLAITNFLTVIFPYTHVEKYPPLAFALELNQTLPRGTIVYYGSVNSDNSLVKYFNRGLFWKKLDQQQLDQDLANGQDVWLETSAINLLSSTQAGHEWLTQHTEMGRQRSLITKAHNIRYLQVTSRR